MLPGSWRPMLRGGSSLHLLEATKYFEQMLRSFNWSLQGQWAGMRARLKKSCLFLAYWLQLNWTPSWVKRSELYSLPLHCLGRSHPQCRASGLLRSEPSKEECESGKGRLLSFLFSNWISGIRWISTLPSASSGFYVLLCSIWGASLPSWFWFLFPYSTSSLIIIHFSSLGS